MLAINGVYDKGKIELIKEVPIYIDFGQCIIRH